MSAARPDGRTTQSEGRKFVRFPRLATHHISRHGGNGDDRAAEEDGQGAGNRWATEILETVVSPARQSEAKPIAASCCLAAYPNHCARQLKYGFLSVEI